MTEKEAIQRLEQHNEIHNKTERFAVYITEAIKMAISALEKQIPKKPDLEGDGYDDNGELIYDTWICPCCGKYYEVYYEEYEFCPKCGQAIDWRE